ncbi:UDP-galactofuranosyl transferase GlfT1 [Nocardia farcinica]|uniref:glycosyltransferase n=1 Tax=Nocardia farcinica TaxID=37329 RepID=UPI00102604A2|nr:glycosyltransferase [Nocardia farcinica]VFA96114.1 UDP-galactofuranosyl transferase GlfT1 [Nocardia farcinica]
MSGQGPEETRERPEPAGTGPDARIVAVVVTHKRRELLAESLKVLTSQSRPIDHLIVVDNGNEAEVAELVDQQPVETTYLGSAHNLGGAGGFALGILHALTIGADWVWLADDDGRPEGPDVLSTLLDCAARHGLAEVSPVVCDIDEPDRLAFPLRRGVVWRRLRSELGEEDFLPGIASLFLRKLGKGAGNVIGHKEWAGAAQGKWDPGGMDMDRFRADVQKAIGDPTSVRGEGTVWGEMFENFKKIKVSYATAIYYIDQKVNEVWEQVGRGWKQLGTNAKANR